MCGPSADAQRRSLERGHLVAGRRRSGAELVHTLSRCSSAQRIISPLTVIKPSHHSLLPMHARRFFPDNLSPQAPSPTRQSQPHYISQHQHNLLHPQQRLHQRVCCDHQFTDRCRERESATCPRSSLLRLDPQASPNCATRLPLHCVSPFGARGRRVALWPFELLWVEKTLVTMIGGSRRSSVCIFINAH